MLQGRPIGEPQARTAPFVMNTEDEIEAAFDDYRATEFGGWSWAQSDPVHGDDPRRFAVRPDGTREAGTRSSLSGGVSRPAGRGAIGSSSTRQHGAWTSAARRSRESTRAASSRSSTPSRPNRGSSRTASSSSATAAGSRGLLGPTAADRIRLVYSLSKSFTGTALGLQLGEGRLTLDDLVSEHLPEHLAGAAAIRAG